MEVGKVFQLFQLIKGKKQVLQPILTGHSGLFKLPSNISVFKYDSSQVIGIMSTIWQRRTDTLPNS